VKGEARPIIMLTGDIIKFYANYSDLSKLRPKLPGVAEQLWTDYGGQLRLLRGSNPKSGNSIIFAGYRL
jgi:hypothetical protein